MEWLPLKPLLLTLPLVAWTSTSMASIEPSPNEASFSACEGLLQGDAVIRNGKECLEYISGYVQDLLTASSDANAQDPEQSLDSSTVNSGLAHRAIATRAGGYMERLHRMAAESACGLQQDERITRITQFADDLGYRGQQLRELVDSVNSNLDHDGSCQAGAATDTASS